MGSSWVSYLVYANLLAQGVLLAGAVWCIAFPSRRIYPMRKKGAWFYAVWLLFYFVFGSNFAFVVTDWNSGPWTSDLRFFVGVPLIALGGAFLAWGDLRANRSAPRAGMGRSRIDTVPRYGLYIHLRGAMDTLTIGQLAARGYRQYPAEAVQRVRFIRHAKGRGPTSQCPILEELDREDLGYD